MRPSSLLATALLAWSITQPALAVCEIEGLDSSACSALAGEARGACLSFWKGRGALEAWHLLEPESPWPLFYLGELAWGSAKAGERLEEAAERFRVDGMVGWQIRSWLAIALNAGLRSELGRADAAFERARSIGDSSSDPLHRLQVAIGEARKQMLQWATLDLAMEALRQALSTLDDHPDPSHPEVYRLEREALRSLSRVARTLGQHRDALDYSETNRGKAEDRGCLYDAAAFAHEETLSWLALHVPDTQTRASAVERLEDNLRTAQEARHEEMIATNFLLLARIEGGPEAANQLLRCRTIAQTIHHAELDRECAFALAARLANERAQPARRQLADGEAMLVQGDDGAMVSGLDRVHAVLRLDGEERASAVLGEMMNAAERLRRNQREVAEARLLATMAPVYDLASGLRFERAERTRSDSDLAAGLAIFERFRAQVLRETLFGPPLEGAGGDDWAPSPDLFERLREMLDPDEALLSFQLGPWEGWDGAAAGGSWLLAIVRDGAKLYRLPGPPEIKPLADAVLRQPTGSPAGERLYDALLADAIDGLPIGVDRLILIPDGILNEIPFASLRPGSGRSMLIERFSLATAPSAELWFRWKRAQPTPDAPHPLVLAAPGGGSSAVSEVRGLSARVARLGPLPYARREARAVLRRLGTGAPTWVGPATKEFLVDRDLAPFNVIHVASHAWSDQAKPWQAGIMLPGSLPGENDVLSFRELSQLDLEGKLVVLSTCESHGGEMLRGEGPLSLARAAFLAGSPAVIATRERLPDRAGALFFDAFYRRVAEGESIGRALALTQRAWIAQGKGADVWANVVLLGNGDLVLAPGGIDQGFGTRIVHALERAWDFHRSGIVLGAGWTLLIVLAVLMVGRRLRASLV